MSLTSKQREVARQTYQSCGSSKEIGEALYIEGCTVASHLGAIYQTLNIKNKVELIAYLTPSPR